MIFVEHNLIVRAEQTKSYSFLSTINHISHSNQKYVIEEFNIEDTFISTSLKIKIFYLL